MKTKVYAKDQFENETIPTRRHKARNKRLSISLYNKIDMIRKVVCGHHTQQFVAREMRVS